MIPCKKKNDRVVIKTANKEERQRKKKRAREKDRNRFASEKQKSCLITSD